MKAQRPESLDSNKLDPQTAKSTQSSVSNGSKKASDPGSLSQWQLIRLRFRRHKLAWVCFHVLIILYTIAIFAEFFAPRDKSWKNLDYAYCPPQIPSFDLQSGLHVDSLKKQQNPITLETYFVLDESYPIPLGFFVESEPYKLLGIIPMNTHFMGVDEKAFFEANPDAATVPPFYFLGADRYGADIFSRLIHGSRISLSIGFVAIGITFLLGVTIGGISGYCGGIPDLLIQRLIEIINSFPHIPLWIAVGAILPPHWSALTVYFGITIVLSLLNWTSLARVVRGKILSLREEDYATAARLLGASHGRILFRHLMPGFMSHIIVTLTLSVPAMILGETALSFLGLGLRPPIVSWGVMLQDCMNLQVLASYPWLLMPVMMIVLTVLSFNFLGDGLRDAADPYASR